MLVTSNFSFSHSVFSRLVQQTHKNQGLFGKGLKSLQTTNLDLMELVESSKRLENTVGKGEIACYKQFLLFPQCFKKNCLADL